MFCMLTTNASELVASIHDRMRLILRRAITTLAWCRAGPPD